MSTGDAHGSRGARRSYESLLSYSTFLALVPIGVYVVVPEPCEEGLLIGLKAIGCLFLQFDRTACNKGLSSCGLEE